MAQQQVGAAAGHEPGQVVEVALHRSDAVLHPALGGPALQRRQRVGAGVDDGDPVAGLGQRDGEAPGTATGVDDVQTTAAGVGLGQHGGQHLPDHGGARRQRGTGRAWRHGAPPAGAVRCGVLTREPSEPLCTTGDPPLVRPCRDA